MPLLFLLPLSQCYNAILCLSTRLQMRDLFKTCTDKISGFLSNGNYVKASETTPPPVSHGVHDPFYLQLIDLKIALHLNKNI